ncbi:MAG: STAS domain-containing protein [Actinomycetota bacterium]|nr:STAS domain-containing protein [Actinomycetota bacterium]
MTQFELEQRGADGLRVDVLTVTGELDLTNAQELRERVDAVAFTNGTALVLDLTRVAFIDSAALHVLFRAARGLSKQRFGLVVEPVSAISRTLEIVGISEVATLGGSVDDLRAALSAT